MLRQKDPCLTTCKLQNHLSQPEVTGGIAGGTAGCTVYNEMLRATPASRDVVLTSTGEKAENELQLRGKDLVEGQRAKPASRDVVLTSTGKNAQNELELWGHTLGKNNRSWSDAQEKELLAAVVGAGIHQGLRAPHRFWDDLCQRMGLGKVQVRQHWYMLNQLRAAETTDRFSALEKVQVLQLVREYPWITIIQVADLLKRSARDCWLELAGRNTFGRLVKAARLRYAELGQHAITVELEKGLDGLFGVGVGQDGNDKVVHTIIPGRCQCQKSALFVF